MRKRLVNRVKYLLWRTSHHPLYLPLVALLSIAGTISMTLPTSAVLAPAVMLRPQRWVRICLAAVLGAATGSTLIAYGFNEQGMEALQARFPELLEADSWKSVMVSVDRYGLWALALIAALPLPQTPALIMCAISETIPLYGIFIAIAAGKLAKYGLVAWMVATFPERFLHYVHKQEHPSQ